MLSTKDTRRQERVAKRLGAAGMLAGKQSGLSGRLKKEHMRELARERRAEAEAEAGVGPLRTTSVTHWAKPASTHAGQEKKDLPRKEEKEEEKKEQEPPARVIDLQID